MLFTIYCEGKNTEPEYFRAVRALLSSALLEIKTVDAAGVPLTIANRAKAQKKAKKKDSFERNDEVWAVFDRDEHPNYDNAVLICEKNGIGVARSNPCFEIWLILHLELFDRPDGRKDVCDHLSEIFPEYGATRGKTGDFSLLMGNLDLAVSRSSVLLERRRNEGMPYGPPSTTVASLIMAIRAAAAAV